MVSKSLSVCPSVLICLYLIICRAHGVMYILIIPALPKILPQRKNDNFFAEWGNSLPNEYFDSIKGRLSDSYSVIGQV